MMVIAIIIYIIIAITALLFKDCNCYLFFRLNHLSIMSEYLKYFDSHTQYEQFTGTTYTKPNVSYCEDVKDIHYNPVNYEGKYLTFTAMEAGTFKFSGNSVDYSLDNGTTWATLASNTNSPTVSAGIKIMWKATLTPTSSAGIGTFNSTGSFVAKGNPMSLLYGDNFIGQTDLTGKDYAFYGLFSGCTGLVSAEHLSLPATTLVTSCYGYMFLGCTSLTKAPSLPATTLAEYCYYSMLRDCTSLTKAPSLPATTLATYCYNGMFSGCTSLNSITCLATNISASSCTSSWLKNVAASGTFTKAASMTSWTTDASGIPSGWTVKNAAS